MPIYGKWMLLPYPLGSLFNNLLTYEAPQFVNNNDVKYFVNRGFFRHLDQVYRI